MRHNVLSGASDDDARPIGVKHKEDPFNDASRALKKALDALNVLEITHTIQPPDFEPGIDFYAEVRRFEIRLIRYALSKTGGRQTLAASLLGMNTTTLSSKIKAYQISRNGSLSQED